jgi:cytochrome c oxidase subunit 4
MHFHVQSVATYAKVYAILIVGLAATYWVSLFDFGFWNIFVAMIIAVFKTMFVVMFFMHLKGSPRLTQIWLASGLFFLLVMFGMSLGDYQSRSLEKGWQPESVSHF